MGLFDRFRRRPDRPGTPGDARSAGTTAPAVRSPGPPGPAPRAGSLDAADRLWSPEETERRRRAVIDGPMRDGVRAIFAEDRSLRSVLVLVGQFWCDEAIDAVQFEAIRSMLDEPDLDAGLDALETGGPDPVNLGGRTQRRADAHLVPGVDSNADAIPLFAAYCASVSDQDQPMTAQFSPLVRFRRDGAKVQVEVVGTRHRPWLDGVRPIESMIDESDFGGPAELEHLHRIYGE